MKIYQDLNRGNLGMSFQDYYIIDDTHIYCLPDLTPETLAAFYMQWLNGEAETEEGTTFLDDGKGHEIIKFVDGEFIADEIGELSKAGILTVDLTILN